MYAGERGGGAVLGIFGGGVTFRFLNGKTIPDENIPLYVRLYALLVGVKGVDRPSTNPTNA